MTNLASQNKEAFWCYGFVGSLFWNELNLLQKFSKKYIKCNSSPTPPPKVVYTLYERPLFESAL